MRSVNGSPRSAAARGCGCLLFAALVSLCSPARAEVRLPHVFGDNMVLQRDKPVKVWGWADKGEKVTVAFAGQTRTATAGDDGKWLLKLDPPDANTPPGRLVARGASNTIALQNVAVGEVWLCSGQSNMEMHVYYAKDGDLELLAADRPGIRVLTIPQRSLPRPQEDFPVETSGWQPEPKGQWLPADPNVVGKFPAVAYFFARQLHEVLKVPVGIIDNSWGGSTVETWISRGALERVPAAAELLKHWDGRIASWSAEEDRKKQLEQWQKRVEKAKAEGKKPPGEPSRGRAPSSSGTTRPAATTPRSGPSRTSPSAGPCSTRASTTSSRSGRTSTPGPTRP
jgi:sialate O-acetylesterase